MKNKAKGRLLKGENIIHTIRKYFVDIGDYLLYKFNTSIRFELMVVIGVCFVASVLFFNVSKGILSRNGEEATVKYDYSKVTNFNNNIYHSLENLDVKDIKDQKEIREVFNRYSNNNECKAYLTDTDGKVFYKTQNAIEAEIHIPSLINNIQFAPKDNRGKEKIYISTVEMNKESYYLIVKGIPTNEITYKSIRNENPFLAMFLSVVVFVVMFLWITNKKVIYLEQISSGLRIIANGNLGYRIEEKGMDEISNLAGNINTMAEEIEKNIEAERKAERMKADLITNVSHDLRTPLTSIMGYIGLVKDNRFNSEEERIEYLKIAFNKAENLKSLIEDLFEYTKLNNEGIQLNKAPINIVGLLDQLIEELMPIAEDNNIELVKNFTKNNVVVDIDGQKMVRVFENLIGNAIKYSFKPGQIVVSLYAKNGETTICIRNKGENIPKEKLDKLFERFYRVEESRNTNTGGTGLGLAIAKNIVNLHNGKVWAECNDNNITFYVKLICDNGVNV